MTTINPIGGPSTTTPPVDTTFQSRMQQALAPVASLFGETPDQLMSELNSGNTSLSALASQKGISQTDLVNAIKQGLQANASTNGQSANGAALSDTQLTNIANRIANHRHGGHHHHGSGAAAAVGSPSTTDPTTSTTATSTTSTTSATTTATEELLALLQSPGQNAF